MTVTVCSTFRGRAFATWDLLARAAAVGSPMGEETITDLNLLELRSRHPQEVITRAFHKRAEAVEGADWEWWLTGPSGQWLGLRVQAKVIDVGTASFPHLHYRRNPRSPYQCEQLIRRALTASPRRVPIYCLYCAWPNGAVNVPWHCGSFPATDESYGCSIVSAAQVQALRRRRGGDTLSALAAHTWPWHCLVCCTGYGPGDLPHRAYAFWRQAILTGDLQLDAEALGGMDLDVRELIGAVELQGRPPAYVLSILEGPTIQLEPPDQDLRVVSIFRELG
jgi:hypothetical protein